MRHSKEILTVSGRVLNYLARMAMWICVAYFMWKRDWPAAQTYLLFLIAMEVTTNG